MLPERFVVGRGLATAAVLVVGLSGCAAQPPPVAPEPTWADREEAVAYLGDHAFEENADPSVVRSACEKALPPEEYAAAFDVPANRVPLSVTFDTDGERPFSWQCAYGEAWISVRPNEFGPPGSCSEDMFNVLTCTNGNYEVTVGGNEYEQFMFDYLGEAGN